MTHPLPKPRFPTENYLNRELGLLAFNRRVLAQAEDERTPLLERLRFLCIVSSNLDEFFEIRMAGTSMACPAVSGAGLLVRQYFTDGFYPTGAKVPAWDPDSNKKPAEAGFRKWCPRGDSNPYDLSRYHLKVVRLPIPPPGQVMRLAPPQHCKADQLPGAGAGAGSGADAGGWV